MSERNDNIKPASSNNNEDIHEMSAEEFQRTLLTWFENKGIVADLRANLRRNMIHQLKNTSLGRRVSHKQTTLAPKAQVVNSLLAEFLMKHKYHFTLSVFSTEVPFTSAPIQDVNNVIDSSFTEENFWNILQTLGFSQDSVYSKKLHDLYFNKHNEPLLTCIIRLLSNLCNKSDLRNEFKNNIFISNDMEPWIKDIYNLLTHFEIPDEIIVKLHDHLKSIFEIEHAKIKTEASTKFNYLHTQIQKDFQSREAEICKMINEMENTFYKEKQKLSEELLNERDSKHILAEKQHEYDDNLAALSRREDGLKQREIDILEQTEILKSRIKIMQNVYDSIVEENARATHIQLQQNITNEQEIVEQSKLQLEYEYLRKEIEEARETKEKFESEEKLLKGLVERVQAENAELRLLNTQQQLRLDELTVKNSGLMNDLENSQATINLLSRSRIAPFRRKVSRRLVGNDSSDDSQSPTDEILQEANQRLKKLEEETESVERSYRAFKERHSLAIQENLTMSMFQPKNSRDNFKLSIHKIYQTTDQNDNNRPSTSHGFTNNSQRIQNENELDQNPRDGYRSSGASSAILPQLHNLSLSSIEMSTDNQDLSDNKLPENDL